MQLMKKIVQPIKQTDDQIDDMMTTLTPINSGTTNKKDSFNTFRPQEGATYIRIH